FSGPVAGLSEISASQTRRYLFAQENRTKSNSKTREPCHWLSLKGISKNNLKDLAVDFPLGLMTTVTGVSGAGKSTLVSQVLAKTVTIELGNKSLPEDEVEILDDFLPEENRPVEIVGLEKIKRLVFVDQKPIGRTPRSNLATYTGLFDHIRKCFALTELARSRKYKAGRFSFNVVGGRCTTCQGEGFVSIELLFLPSVYAACNVCHGSRYNNQTLAVTFKGLNIAQVLDLSVDAACQFFREIKPVARALDTLKEVGLGYLKLGQPATELSGGEAQRIKLATELQRERRGDTLYLLDEPTTGLHPFDVEQLMNLLSALVDAGNTVIIVEHDLDVIACSDWLIDLGPGAADKGGRVVACGTPRQVAESSQSRTAPYLKRRLAN
ncbi:MAG: hypothetical protein K8F91_09115, partial [Candidatus Obscuribacterales bacterium]|nr:hypothetical protein [Candidatus Obscuribacterales bacterium]